MLIRLVLRSWRDCILFFTLWHAKKATYVIFFASPCQFIDSWLSFFHFFIDLRAISIAESTDYGVLRMIVDDAAKASNILLQHGDILSMTPVWAVEVPDRPGGLAEVLSVLADAHVDVEYMYSLFTHRDGCAYMVLRISDEAAFLKATENSDIRLVGSAELGIA